MPKLTYFSHSMKDYNTDKEAKALKFIEYLGFSCINPNGDLKWRGSMDIYFAAIKKAGFVHVLEHDNLIGRGVFQEVEYALAYNIPVFAIQQDPKRMMSLDVVKVKGIMTVTPTDWALNFGQLIF